MSYNSGHRPSSERNWLQMLSEISILLLKVILKFLVRTFRLILKIIKLLIALLMALISRIIVFWNSNSTQDKVKKFKLWLKDMAIYITKAFVWLLQAIWRGIIWLLKATLNALINLRPTLYKIWQGLIKLSKIIWQLLIRCWHRFILFYINRKQAYNRFRRNKGFKGLLIDIKQNLHKQLDIYMNEDDDDNDDTKELTNTVGDAEFISEEIGQNNKIRIILNKLYNALKKLITND